MAAKGPCEGSRMHTKPRPPVKALVKTPKAKAKKSKTFPTLLAHAGVRTWEELRARHPACPIAKPIGLGFDIWCREQDAKGAGLTLDRKQRVYSEDVTFEEKVKYDVLSSQDYGRYLLGLESWYKAHIGQRSGPFVRK